MRLFCLQLEVSYLQLSFLLTIALWSFFAYNFSFVHYSGKGFVLTVEIFAYNGKVHLIGTAMDCKQRLRHNFASRCDLPRPKLRAGSFYIQTPELYTIHGVYRWARKLTEINGFWRKLTEINRRPRHKMGDKKFPSFDKGLQIYRARWLCRSNVTLNFSIFFEAAHLSAHRILAHCLQSIEFLGFVTYAPHFKTV